MAETWAVSWMGSWAGESQRVGPHGYIHGWIFLGAPGVGDRVFHSHHGHGSVSSVSGGHATVTWDKSGESHHVPIQEQRVLFHGTNADLKPGDHINTNYGYAHATTNKLAAATYARLRGGQHIYEVKPLGPVEHDTRMGGGVGATSSYRSQHPFTVVRKLPEAADEIYFGRLAGTKRAETSPGDVKGTERLHEYWVHGPGAAKIRWGSPGDYDRCVLHLGKFLADPHGYCAKAHHDALGIWPATHAAEIKHATGRAAMADTKAKPYGDVTYADPKNGKYPIDTEAHAKAAWSYVNMPKNAAMYPLNGVTLSEVKDRIMAACKKFGIDISGGDSGRAESPASYVRSFPLEDLSVRTTRDGRIVEAYLAVFNTPAEIHDQDGDYSEELDPVVFNRAISDARPQGSRTTWRVGVFYNHGLTIMGTPSDRHSMPVAVPVDIKTDGHGVRATDKYHRSQFCDEIIEGLESGAIPGYSFSGRFRRSNPLIPRGGFRKDRAGNLPAVRRMESTLREYGPTPFPAYADAAVLGIRSDSLMAAMLNDPDTAMRMLSMFRDGAPEDSPPPSGAPPDGDSPAEDSHRLVRSGRSVKEEMQAARSAFLQRYRR